MSGSTFDKADRLFAPDAFWRRIVPTIAANGLVICCVFLAAANRAGGITWSGFALALGMAVFLCLFNLFRYTTAKARHDDLKLRFGDGYRALIDERKVVLNLTTILYIGQPKGVRWKYFNEGNPWD